MKSELRAAFGVIARALDRFGIIPVEQFRRTTELAGPRIVTGFSIMSKQTADLAMVGIAVGTAGTAGLAFAFAYWQMVTLIGLGIAGGTISLVSQNYGSGESERAARVIIQSIIITVGVAVPIMALFFLFAGPLISLLSSDPESLRHGTVYLAFVTPAVLFELLNLIASRTYTGIGDTFTEMIARGGGAVLNVILSALLIFGFSLDVAGAALGTTLSTGFVTLVLTWGMVGRSYGRFGMEPSPVPITRAESWIDTEITRQLVEICVPEIGRRLVGGLIVFPLLWIAASFGPIIVTAIEVGRRIRLMINSINWGLSLASSSLVGRCLGADEEAEAELYGASIIRLSIVVHVGVAVLVVLFASPIAGIFVSNPAAVTQVAAFVAVGAISSIGIGIDGTATGALLGAGATRWPFVASMIGRYGFALPVAALGLVTPLGITALYLALLLETFIPGGINYWLFRTGKWKVISRQYRGSSGSS